VFSSLLALGTSFIGLHFGHVLVHQKNHITKLWHWLCLSIDFLVIGIFLHFFGVPFNKSLYNLHYLFFTVGVANAIFVAIYFVVDMCNRQGLTSVFEIVGQNSLLLFQMVALGLLLAFLQGLYWKSPQNNIITFLKDHVVHHYLGFTKWI
jgi:heparan-alpha-glucosaminide N-acetyltransferase